MINSQNLIDKICACIAGGGQTSLQTCQNTNALTFLNNPVTSVSTFSSLPSANLHVGRLFYVLDERRYYTSLEGIWVSDFSSFPSNLGSLTLSSWGVNNCGQLGDGTTTCRSSPVSVLGGFTDWCQVSAGSSFTLGLRTNGTVWRGGSGTTDNWVIMPVPIDLHRYR